MNNDDHGPESRPVKSGCPAPAGGISPGADRMHEFEIRLERLDAFARATDLRLELIEASLPEVAVARDARMAASAPPKPIEQVSPRPTVAVKPPSQLSIAPISNADTQETGDDVAPELGTRATVAVSPPSPLHRVLEQPIELRRSWSATDFERIASGRGLAWIGGLAILLGAIFFLSLAFSHGWIGPAARVIIGLAAGVTLTLLGGWILERRDPLLGHVLIAVGIGVWNLGLFAATRLYDLAPVELGLLGVLGGALAAAAIAVRVDAQVVAGYGIVSALAAPPLLGAGPTGPTIAFLGVTLVGTTAIALRRSWVWLPPIAFGLSAPQAAVWFLGQPPTAAALIALVGFWSLYAAAAAGEEAFRSRATLRPSAASLVLVNTAFLISSGFVVLDGPNARWRGLFLVAVAATHLAIGYVFLRRYGDRHPFGLLTAGTGVAALGMAAPVQFNGSVVPVTWAAQAAALAWIYSQRRQFVTGLFAIALGLLAAAHFFTFEYPLLELASARTSVQPFLNANSLTLGFLLATLVVSGAFVKLPWVRIALTLAGFALIVGSVPHELSGLPLLAAWSSLTVLAFAIERWGPVSDAMRQVSQRPPRLPFITHGLHIPVVIATTLAAGHLLAYDLPLSDLAIVSTRPGTPFIDRGTLAAAIVVAAALAVAWVAARRFVRDVAIAATFAVIGYLAPFELGAVATVVAWAALALGALRLDNRGPGGWSPYSGVAAGLLAAGVLITFAVVAPFDRLFVDRRSTVDHLLFWSGATVALVSLVVAFGAGSWMRYGSRGSVWLGAAAGALVVYLLSIGVVDEFQRRVDGVAATVTLAKQAQVALSVLWAVIGGVTIAAGLIRLGAPVRLFGLALLGLATVKVFLYDLASLDATYRVLSFIGLGLLLLATSYAYGRQRRALSAHASSRTTASHLDA
ncbi:MAG: DUF2339 domain-containing protein [Chloroflexota bacterium]|nr:DUF2339 domain-containing protein [Chloroflexota bacterium]